jgi:hypothetical protein
MLQYAPLLGCGEAGGSVLLHEEHCHPSLTDGADLLENHVHQERREPQGRLIHHQQLRIQHEGSADYQHLLLAPTEAAG